MSLPSELAELKKKFLELLEEDKEFRYTVAGYLGLSEIMKRLDAIEREQLELRKEQARMREDFERTQKTIEQILETLGSHTKTLESHTKMLESHGKTLESHTEMLESHKKILDSHTEILESHTKILEHHTEILERHTKILEHHTEILERHTRILESHGKRLSRIERTLEKLTLDIEDEARSIVSHRLKQMGLDIKVDRLQLPELELNIYGASDDVCVLGEASVRANLPLLEELKRKYEKLKATRPDLLRKRVILVIYTSLAMPELVEVAEKEGIWVLKATGDIVPLKD